MKTTVELPDDLYRRAKLEAALRGRKAKDLVEQGLRLVLETPRAEQGHHDRATLMKAARRVVKSGIVDLASNPESQRFRPRCVAPSLMQDLWSRFSIISG